MGSLVLGVFPPGRCLLWTISCSSLPLSLRHQMFSRFVSLQSVLGYLQQHRPATHQHTTDTKLLVTHAHSLCGTYVGPA